MIKRIAFLFPTLENGGVFKVMTNLANGFHHEGYSIDILTARGNDNYVEQYSSPDYRFYPFHVHHMIAGFPKLLHYIRDQKPDFLISAQAHTNLSAVLACKLSGSLTQCIVTEHSYLPAEYSNAETMKEKLVLQLTKVLYKSADAIVGVSQGVTNGLKEWLGWEHRQIHTIHTAMVNKLLLDMAKEPLSHPWFEADQPPVILSVGRLATPKNYETLINAFSIIRKSKKVRLMILGEGDKRETLQHLIEQLGLKEDVLLPGFVENPLAYMRKASVFVLSSAWEGFPSVLVEALVCNTPIVSTRCESGPDEILEDGKWGELVPVNDPESLADGILRKLNSGPIPGQVMYANRFSTENAVKAYIQLMDIIGES